MDGQRFDTFTKLLAGGRNRRQLLRSIAGLGAGLLIGAGRAGGAAASHCGLLGSDCDPNGTPCCPGFGCDPDTLKCVRTCLSIGESCAGDGDCCPDLFCQDGTCGVPTGCVAFGDDCTSDEECCGTQFGPGICNEQQFCSACGPEDTPCTTNHECCSGLQCLGNRQCGVCGEIGEACTPGTCCNNVPCVDGVCQLTPACIEAGQACDENAVCCDDLLCIAGICGGPPCHGAGEGCDDEQDCCEGLVCTDGVCAAPQGSAATVTIHTATCSTGVGADIFDACHGNALAGVGFSVNGTGVVTGSNGAAAAGVDAGQVTVTEDVDVLADYLGAYVYCSEQNSGTVLHDGSADDGSVSFTVADGDDVVCDWYNITEAEDGDDDGDDDEGGGTELPDTGSGTIGGGTGAATPWLGAALIGGAAALLAGKRLRDGSAPSGATD